VARLALVAALLAVLVAAVAFVDHRHKRSVEFAAQEDAWFCAHGDASRCREFDEVAYEQRWEDREFAYRVGVFALGAAAIGFGLAELRRRQALAPHR
jgi:hypothetical protein